jgi:hypothetical protein
MIFPRVRHGGALPYDGPVTRRQALILRAFAVWTVYVWVTRMWNIFNDHTRGHGAGFKAVHTTLAVISVAFAVVAWQIVTSVARRPKTSDVKTSDTGEIVRQAN